MGMYLESLFVAAQLVIGQSLWKVGVTKYHFVVSKEFFLSKDFLRFFFSWQVLTGLVVYAFATLFYMALLSKYEYSIVQTLVTSLALITAYVIASFFFHEKISLLNLFGLALIIIGISLAVKRV
jgi:drug/metabolite transporter (DMT)-like permease